MGVLKVILTILIVIISIGMTVLILMQEGKGNGLSGSIAGGADSYVSRNQGRTAEGKMVRYTTILVAAFMIISLVLNIL